MKLLYPSTTIALAASALPGLTNGYNMGGYRFGRPVVVTRGRCGPYASCNGQRRSDWVNSAFDDLENELNRGGFPGGPTRRRSSRRRGSGRFDFESDQEDAEMRKKRVERFRQQQKEQQEMFKKAVDLANDVVTGLSSDAIDGDSMKQQKEWLNRAFGIASDVASGRSSPRYEVSNSDDKYQISLDVPGVKLADIDIRVVDDEEHASNSKTLVIKGKRESSLGGEKEPIEFSKEFTFDAAVVDVDTIAAELSNGVLLVSASKIPKKEPEQMKIEVVQVPDKASASEDSASDGAVDVATVEMKTEEDATAEDSVDEQAESGEAEEKKP